MAVIDDRLEQLLNQLGREGIIDDQFAQLLQLQDESNPHFIDEVITLYFDDCSSKIEKLMAKLSQPQVNFGELDQIVHQLKGSSASFGARAIAHNCVQVQSHTSLAAARQWHGCAKFDMAASCRLCVAHMSMVACSCVRRASSGI